MATASARFKSGPQDMPPPGGYDPIQTSRVHLRRVITRNKLIYKRLKKCQ